MGWKDSARRQIIGEKKDLDSFEGYWIQPKKYSIQAKDEIAAIQRKIQKGIDKKALASIMEKAKGVSEQELVEKLNNDELGVMLDVQNVESKEMIRLKILHGVEAHNFDDVTTEELANDILEFEAVALEILGIVEDFNRPLAERTSKTSKM